MKGIVNTYLNERTQQPSVNASSPKYYQPGDVIEIVAIVNGDVYKDNKVWYQLDNGAFVWSGGVEDVISIVEDSLPQAGTFDSISWGINELEINHIWQEFGSLGKGVQVAVLDTGILDAPDFEGRIDFKDFYGNSAQCVDEDAHIHGTQCGGLIASAHPKNYGVAPECSLLACRVMKSRLFPTQKNINKALEWILTERKDIDVISISIAMLKEDDQMKKLVNEAINANKIIVAAAGNIEGEAGFYPASYSGVLSIGAVNDRLMKIEKSASSEDLSMLAPGFQLPTTGHSAEQPLLFSGTSAATAFMAGTFALLLNYIKINNINITIPELVQTLQKSATDYGPSGADKMSGFGIVNPLKTIKSL